MNGILTVDGRGVIESLKICLFNFRITATILTFLWDKYTVHVCQCAFLQTYDFIVLLSCLNILFLDRSSPPVKYLLCFRKIPFIGEITYPVFAKNHIIGFIRTM